MNPQGLNRVPSGLREFVRREALGLVTQVANGMEESVMNQQGQRDEPMDAKMSDEDLGRYGEQLQSLLSRVEQRLTQTEGEEGRSGTPVPDNDKGSGTPASDQRAEDETGCETGVTRNKRPSRDLMRHDEADVSKTNPNNGAWCDIQGRRPAEVPERNPKKETFDDIPGPGAGHVSEPLPENGASRDMVCRDRSSEAIEQFAQETSPDPIDPTDPTTHVHRRQLLAISGLLCGSTVTDTANQVGVNRRTVHRWMHDAKFQAAYRHCEAELRMAAQAQVAGLAEKAVRCVSESLDRGNARVGLELLKQLRVFSLRATPDRIVEAQQRKAVKLLESEGVRE